MSEVGILALRGLAGGALVVLTALIGEVLRPKSFAGLFSSAPSVAVAGLAITIVFKGAATARQDSIGMVVGGIAMAVCCALAALAIPKVRAVWGSVVAWLGWAAVAGGLYWAVFLGAH